MKTVSSVMTKDVKTIEYNKGVKEAYEIMEKNNFRHLIVTRESAPIGIISMRNLSTSIYLMTLCGKDSQIEPKVEDILQQYPITLKPGDSVIRAAQIMRENKIGAIPILAKENIVGIVTTHDLLKVLIDQLSYQWRPPPLKKSFLNEK